MNTPTYKEQFDKLTRAYISNEINPWNSCACFVGNLLNNTTDWADGRDVYVGKPNRRSRYYNISVCSVREQSNGLYSYKEIVKLEAIFLKEITDNGGNPHSWDNNNITQKDEDALFLAFEKTLEVLKQIHISKGENIEGEYQFKKRELVVNEINN